MKCSVLHSKSARESNVGHLLCPLYVWKRQLPRKEGGSQIRALKRTAGIQCESPIINKWCSMTIFRFEKVSKLFVVKLFFSSSTKRSTTNKAFVKFGILGEKEKPWTFWCVQAVKKRVCQCSLEKHTAQCVQVENSMSCLTSGLWLWSSMHVSAQFSIDTWK